MKKLLFLLLIPAFASAQTVDYNIRFNTAAQRLKIIFPQEVITTDSVWVRGTGGWFARISTVQLFKTQGADNWNTAYSWGNHAGLYRPIGYIPVWTEITGKPTTFTPSAHTHPISDITNLQTTLDTKLAAVDWSIITNKPATYSPSAHTHAISDITGLQTALNTKLSAVDWSIITNKPATYPPAAHTHIIADVSGLQTTLDSKLSVLPTIGTPGVYTKVTTDLYGRVTVGANATKADIGLANVDNTSDINKPVSTAVQAALDTKQSVRKEFYGRVTPTTANGYTINYASAGFTTVPVIQITPQTSNSAILTLPLVVIGTATTTSCTVYILNSGNQTISLLGVLVQGLVFATNLTGVQLNVTAIQP